MIRRTPTLKDFPYKIKNVVWKQRRLEPLWRAGLKNNRALGLLSNFAAAKLKFCIQTRQNHSKLWTMSIFSHCAPCCWKLLGKFQLPQTLIWNRNYGICLRFHRQKSSSRREYLFWLSFSIRKGLDYHSVCRFLRTVLTLSTPYTPYAYFTFILKKLNITHHALVRKRTPRSERAQYINQR